jgi:hypothetical protein
MTPVEKGWQDISSAPRDGTDILVCYQNCDSWFYHKAFWMEGDEVEIDEIGWWSYLLSEVTRTKLDGPFEPTHWRPDIPAPGAECTDTERDAARFQYLQNCDPVVAQAYFWRYSSRRERRKAIDVAMSEGKEKP